MVYTPLFFAVNARREQAAVVRFFHAEFFSGKTPFMVGFVLLSLSLYLSLFSSGDPSVLYIACGASVR
jgi:hypothetical protein